jgi:hypothetical protein
MIVGQCIAYFYVAFFIARFGRLFGVHWGQFYLAL